MGLASLLLSCCLLVLQSVESVTFSGTAVKPSTEAILAGRQGLPYGEDGSVTARPLANYEAKSSHGASLTGFS